MPAAVFIKMVPDSIMRTLNVITTQSLFSSVEKEKEKARIKKTFKCLIGCCIVGKA